MKVIKTRYFRNNLKKTLRRLPVVIANHNTPIAIISKPPKGIIGKFSGEFYPKKPDYIVKRDKKLSRKIDEFSGATSVLKGT